MRKAKLIFFVWIVMTVHRWDPQTEFKSIIELIVNRYNTNFVWKLHYSLDGPTVCGHTTSRCARISCRRKLVSPLRRQTFRLYKSLTIDSFYIDIRDESESNICLVSEQQLFWTCAVVWLIISYQLWLK